MSDIVNVSEENVESYASSVKGAAAYFRSNPLVPYDDRSTISANGKGQVAYYRSQECISFLGSCLEQEAENIRTLGLRFEEYDKMLADLWDSGTRYPVFQTVQ